MEMRELRAHEIARKAAACWAVIDETIPGLLKTMALREMADIGWTLPLLAPSCGNLTRRGSSKEVSPSNGICLWPESSARA
jgi:hypothetical protein